MATFAARRTIDGFLGTITDVPNMPSNLIERAIAGYGGAPEDWQPILLTDSEAQQLPAQQNGAKVYLNGGVITIIAGFPAELAAQQQANFKRGFIINKPVTDIRKRKVTRIGVFHNG